MKQILLLATGGTIASRPTPEGLAPIGGADYLSERLEPLRRDYRIDVRSILELDSSNIQPEEWQLIARRVYAARGSYDGIVISHGTDTMAYTASMLSYMLLGIELPVVLTGSQLPLDHPLSDGMDNLRAAFAMAASGRRGVFVAFDRRILLGCRAVKTHTTDFAAFESVNYPPVARISGAGLTIDDAVIPEVPGPCVLRDRICREVFLLKLTPGIDPAVFGMLTERRYRGLLIEAFGAGGLHFIRRNLVEELRRAAEAGMVVAVSSQCLYESSDFSLYQTGQKVLEQGAIECRDMTTEAAITKLMWALGQTKDAKEVRRMFAASLAGEMTERKEKGTSNK